jgi:hypothetical protein
LNSGYGNISNLIIHQLNYQFYNTLHKPNYKSSESDLFVDYNRLLLNNKDINQYVKDVINEIGKKNINNKNNKKE